MEAAMPVATWSKYEGSSFDGVLPRLVEPEVLLPSQFFDQFRTRSILEGERRLMLAVLEDAVACFQKYAGATRPRGKRMFHEAEEWFFEAENSWPFSFEGICSVVGINPDYFRKELAAWKARLLAEEPQNRGKIGRVRLRAARRHKILPFVPRRRNKTAAAAS
jgi:hypothetical protein